MINYTDFISIAQFVTSNQKSEIACRVGISRVYYGTYHLALNYSVQKNYANNPFSSVHSNLIQFLEATKQKDMVIAARLMKKMKRYRVTSDYYINELVSENDFKHVYKMFETIESKLK